MKTEDMIRELRNVADKYRGKVVHTGEVNITLMCEEVAKRLEELSQPKTDWIPCEVDMPKEHDSMFVKLKGTDKWSSGMFEKTSDEVNVTIEFPDGTRITRTSHTIDGEWKDEKFSHLKSKVIAWQPLPASYKKEGDSGAT